MLEAMLEGWRGKRVLIVGKPDGLCAFLTAMLEEIGARLMRVGDRADAQALCRALTGVTAVSCFNDREVVLETGEGEVALLGENLHIEQLNLDDGQLDVTGEIAGVEYETPRKQERRGLFGRKKA